MDGKTFAWSNIWKSPVSTLAALTALANAVQANMPGGHPPVDAAGWTNLALSSAIAVTVAVSKGI